MATIIDALVVTLGLDGSKFKQGQKEAEGALKRTRDEAGTAAKEIEARGKQAADFFVRLRRTALELFAVLTAGRGMHELVAGSTAATAQVGRLATSIGMAAQELSAWQGAAERFGGSAGATAGSLQGLSQSFQEFQVNGTSQVIPFFRQMEVGIADATGRLRPMGDILLDVADKFRSMTPQRRLFFGAALGLDQGTVDLLGQGRGAVQGVLADQRRLGVVTDSEAANAARRRSAWLDFTQALETASRRIMDGLTPAVTSVLEKLTEFVQYLGGENFLPTFKAVEAQIKRFADYLGAPAFRADLASFASGVKEVAEAMVEALRFLGVISRPRESWQLPMGDDPNSGLPGPSRRGTLRQSNPGGGFYQPASYTPGGSDAGGALDPAAVRDRLARNLGLSTDQAAGIVSGLHRESGLRPGITRPGGQDFGLAQWTDTRRTALEAFAANRNTTRDDPEAQLAFIEHELQTTYRGVLNRIRASRTPTEAGRAFHDYEASGGGAPNPAMEHLRDWHADQADRISRLPGGRMPETLAGTNAAGRSSALNSSAASGGSTTQVNINGPITVHTQATDAQEVAAGLGGALRQYAFVPQANTGLT